jgi:sRNA-binding carbon storage regulator CsrA
MTSISLKKNQAVIIARSGSAEQVLKIEVAALNSDQVRLEFVDTGGVSIHTDEDWQRLQAERQTARVKHGTERPRERAPYMN